MALYTEMFLIAYDLGLVLNDHISQQKRMTAALFWNILNSHMPQSVFTPHQNLSTFAPTLQYPSRHYACLLCFQLPYFLCFSFQLLLFPPNHTVRKFTGLQPLTTSPTLPVIQTLLLFCFQYPYAWENRQKVTTNTSAAVH